MQANRILRIILLCRFDGVMSGILFVLVVVSCRAQTNWTGRNFGEKIPCRDNPVTAITIYSRSEDSAYLLTEYHRPKLET